MVMLKDPSIKYKAFKPISLPNRTWPDKILNKPPRWLSTDLRDGNQALPDPMSVEEKKIYFKKLVEIGFKEIEVAFPSASQTDFDFTRWTIENAPSDVSIQVLSPCRPDLIKRTIESLEGAKIATVHIYLATSSCFRRVVYQNTKEDSIDLAKQCTQLVKDLTTARPHTNWNFEFSPEFFVDSDLDFVLQLCEEVKAIWDPTVESPIIFNLPATVELATPNCYADQIEFFAAKISEREKVCISLHPHNDRGCAIAAAELGQMAGADRVEGTLFGNGERTGNVDLVTLALNLYTQGYHPKLDFSDLSSIVDIVERCNKIPVHPRTPYGGSLVVCAFSGSHQDAIKKGFVAHEHQVKTTNDPHWDLPYLPLDPTDIGRTYEAIIRVNSQSGKGGSAWVILRNLELDLPRGLQVDFSQVVQHIADTKGRELTNLELCELFKNNYFILWDDATDPNYYYKLLDYSLSSARGEIQLSVELQVNGKKINIKGTGIGPISAFTNAVANGLDIDIDVKHYHEHSLGNSSNSKAATYIECSVNKEKSVWGVGIDEDVSFASFLSLVSILNGLNHKA